MIKHLFTLLLCAVLALLPVVPSHGEGQFTEDLLVTHKVTIPYRSQPYIFRTITVEEAGELTIEAGTVIQLRPQARITVKGALVSNGTANRRIRFFAESKAPWDGLVVYPSAAALAITHTDFQNFQQPVRLNRSFFTFKHNALIDGWNNVLEVGSPTTSFPPVVQIEQIVFANRLRGTTMQDSGIKLYGSFSQIRVNNLLFQDARALRPLQQFMGILVDGSFSALNAVAVSFAAICSSSIRNHQAGEHTEVVVNPASCKLNRIPVVFVPGYGTSINLKKLSKASNRSIDLSGWRFLATLTPAYTDFIAELKKQRLSYDIAYYDWRLPAEVIADGYVKPVIDRIKQQTGVPFVQLVTHSYGGLVARSYIQGDGYAGDVAQLVQLGTPNQGAVKAYPVWEAGELPSDWRSLLPIIRLYQYQQRPRRLTAQEMIHQYFPSARELLPIYPAIQYQSIWQNPEQFRYRNDFLIALQNSLDSLLQRVQVATVSSASEKTQEYLVTDSPSGGTSPLWPDGKPLAMQPVLTATGDGTVPQKSVELQGAHNLTVTGSHAALPVTAKKTVLSLLYPHLSVTASAATVPNYKFFVFDCPIVVRATLPDGTVRSSAQPDTEAPQVGEVEESDEMLWMLLPEQPGTYQLEITALLDTEVRGWEGGGPITTTFLRKGEQTTWTYSGGAFHLPPSQGSENPGAPAPANLLPLATDFFSVLGNLKKQRLLLAAHTSLPITISQPKKTRLFTQALSPTVQTTPSAAATTSTLPPRSQVPLRRAPLYIILGVLAILAVLFGRRRK